MISPLSLDHVLNVYSVDGDDKPQYRLVGRLLDSDHGLDVLADYHGLLQKLAGPPSEEQTRRFDALQRSPYLHVVSLGEIQRGEHPELLPSINMPGLTGKPNHDEVATFEYLRHGLRDPLLIQFRGGTAYLNGQPLSRLELQQLTDTIASGQAELRRYRHSEVQLQKMELDLENLIKMDPKLRAALGQVKGALDPESYQTIMREIFADPMLPEMGGKKAYAHFLENPQPGIHIRIDGNDFGAVNKIHGFDAGDSAIKAMGNAIRNAKQEADRQYAPPKAAASADPTESDLDALTQSKMYRIGGDEFHVFIPQHEKAHEHAAAFTRAMRHHMEAVPPVGGTHGISASVGMGHTPEHSDLALISAKTAKKGAAYLPGQAKTHVHSLLPGHEGPVPVQDAPAVKPPPAPELPEVLKPK